MKSHPKLRRWLIAGVVVAAVAASMQAFLVATGEASYGATPAASTTWAHKGAYINPSSSTSLSSAATTASMKELKSTGVNEVLFVYPFHQDTASSYTFNNFPNTPTPASLKAAVVNAHNLGLKAYISFHVEYGGSGTWRAYINPAASHRTTWYLNYANVVINNSRYTGADGILVGTELYNTFATVGNKGYPVDKSNGANVANLVKRVKYYYHGIVSYDAQVDGGYGDINLINWNLFSDIRATTYFAITGAPNTASMTASLNQSYVTKLAAVHKKYPTKAILAGETGYRSVAGASRAPYSYGMTGAVDEAEQSRDYSVLFATLDRLPWIKGVGLWYWESGYTPDASDFSPRGKSAEAVMTQAFGGTYKPPVVTPLPPVVPTLNVWWPTENTAISCTQPFQAVLDSSVPIASYTMYWRVDGGQWNFMANVGDHFQQDVNVAPWHWNDAGNSQYTVTFEADSSSNGAVLQSKSVVIYVDHSGDAYC